MDELQTISAELGVAIEQSQNNGSEGSAKDSPLDKHGFLSS